MMPPLLYTAATAAEKALIRNENLIYEFTDWFFINSFRAMAMFSFLENITSARCIYADIFIFFS